MWHAVEKLEKSRRKGFRPRHVFGALLREFLGLSDGLRILDLGCGSGFFSRIVAEQCQAEIVGVDVDKQLLDGARGLARDQNLGIEYVVGDVTATAFADGSFDLVMCAIMLEAYPDVTLPLSEMKRVCKEGGAVAAIEPFYQSCFVYYPETDDETRDVLLEYMRADRGFGLGPMLPHYFHTIGLERIDLVSWLWGGIGYKCLECETIQERLKGLGENLQRIREFLPSSRDLGREEQSTVLEFYEERLRSLEDDPDRLKTDMSVGGMPVFIVKGHKRQPSIQEEQHG